MHLDVELFRRFYGGSGVWLWVMCAATIVGSGWAMIPIASLAAFKKTRRAALELLAVLVVVAIVVVVLKLTFGRVRPCGCLANVHALVFSAPTDPSFPSGHAAGAFAVAAFFAFEARAHVAAKIALFVVAAAIGFSRIVLGVHFPSDVLAGATLGVVIVLAMKKVRNGTVPTRIS